ncbi:ArsR/SmtB family transcription factor [Neisseria animalis]|uniref:ArsR family transcriptional regulator n=1 Tax=Neisseria animalis TaxID=492 RepID=A0A5P3MNZ1_NEIAN|nr:metalloregulator ArsR/SmtB family transcription factor [Neisseria animalis]QEY23272.1 ArsR family transcriptional regulator [Neisseria animalis]ROW31973.1 ArsR family transcriptional regulator [Neisseria animalis]VEE08557.1 Arsenical resistance operon repressor [Neisseria animalis]
MNTEQAGRLFESLSSPARLAIFQQLTQAGSQGMIAGDLAKALEIAPNNLSFHLKNLAVANLVRSENEGRFVRYYANLDLMMDLVSFLTANCCQNSGDEPCKSFCG